MKQCQTTDVPGEFAPHLVQHAATWYQWIAAALRQQISHSLSFFLQLLTVLAFWITTWWLFVICVLSTGLTKQKSCSHMYVCLWTISEAIHDFSLPSIRYFWLCQLSVFRKKCESGSQGSVTLVTYIHLAAKPNQSPFLCCAVSCTRIKTLVVSFFCSLCRSSK